MTHLLWLVLGILGCKDKAAEPTIAQVEPAPPAQPSAYEYEGEIGAAVFDQASIEEAMQGAVDVVRDITGHAPLAAYLEMVAHGDDYCPQRSTYEGSVYWYGGCTTSGGTFFSGYAFYEEYEDEPLLGEDSALNGPTLNGQGMIMDEDGTRLDIGGGAHAAHGPVEDGVYGWLTGVSGAFKWNADEVDNSWMGTALRPDIESMAMRWAFPTGDGGEDIHVLVSTTLGLTGLDTAWSTVFMANIMAATDLGGYWPCPEEPAGTISVRSPSGHWFQVVFDPEQDESGAWSTPPGTCDGCGTVYQAGEESGLACVDVGPMLDWEDQPW